MSDDQNAGPPTQPALFACEMGEALLKVWVKERARPWASQRVSEYGSEPLMTAQLLYLSEAQSHEEADAR